MKSKLYASTIITMLAVTGCAELNDVLGTTNEVMRTLTGSVSGGMGKDKTYRLGNRSTAKYEITGLTMLVSQVTDRDAEIDLTGHIRNKTNKSITVDFEAPIYEKDGDYLNTFRSFVVVPANSSTKISNSDLIRPWTYGSHVNISKFKISVRRF